MVNKTHCHTKNIFREWKKKEKSRRLLDHQCYGIKYFQREGGRLHWHTTYFDIHNLKPCSNMDDESLIYHLRKQVFLLNQIITDRGFSNSA